MPICLECADERKVKHKRLEMERQINTVLVHDVTEAKERAHTASDAFEAIVADQADCLTWTGPNVSLALRGNYRQPDKT